MKRKRYFCDWLRDVMEQKAILLQAWIIIIGFIIVPISSVTCYQVTKAKYGPEIKSYFEDRYVSFNQVETKIIIDEDEASASIDEYKEVNESTKEEYAEPLKYFLYLMATLIGLFTFLVIFLVICIVIFIAESISKTHKNRYRRKNFHKRKR